MVAADGEANAQVAELQQLLAVEVPRHRLRHLPPVREADPTLEGGSGLGESNPAGASVRRVIEATHEPAILEASDKP